MGTKRTTHFNVQSTSSWIIITISKIWNALDKIHITYTAIIPKTYINHLAHKLTIFMQKKEELFHKFYAGDGTYKKIGDCS